jgi:hypothetical protein
MYHRIEFAAAFTLDLEISPKQPLERLRIQKGTRLRAQVKPHVAETEAGPVEVADLFFEDGTVTRRVPFAWFSFVE